VIVYFGVKFGDALNSRCPNSFTHSTLGTHYIIDELVLTRSRTTILSSHQGITEISSLEPCTRRLAFPTTSA